MSTEKNTAAVNSPQQSGVLWLSSKGAAKRLGVSDGEMLALLHSGRIPAARSQGKHRPTWRVPVEELERFAREEAERQTAERLGEAS